MRRFVHEYVLKVVVGIGVTSTVAIAALLNKYWTWPNAVVGSVLLLCGILYLMEKFGIGPSMKSRVRDWLDSSSYSIQTISDANEFHFVMTDNVGMRTDILQAKADSPIMVVTPKNLASQEQLAAFKSLNIEQQRMFWRGIRLELLKYGAGFSNLSLEGEGVAFSDSIPASRALTGTEFLKRVFFVRAGARLYWELLLELHDPKQDPAQ